MLTLSREIRREGRSVARVNGRTAGLSLVRELGSYLVDIHGQSEHLSLLNVRQHIHLLDRFAACQPGPGRLPRQPTTACRSCAASCTSCARPNRTPSGAPTCSATSSRRSTRPTCKPGEEEELRQERDRLANAEHLAS